MPPTFEYPAVYVEELADASHSIEGIPTSVAIFIGWASRGAVDAPVRIASLAEYAQQFGAPDARSDFGPSIAHFFANGGNDAWVVRLAASDATAATAGTGAMRLLAASPGAWGNRLRINLVKRRGLSQRFRIDVREGNARSPVVERYDDLSLASGDARHAPTLINAASTRLRIDAVDDPVGAASISSQAIVLAGGSDGAVLVAGRDDFRTTLMKRFEAGGPIAAIDRFDLLCVPGESSPATQVFLQAECAARGACYVADCDPNATLASLARGPDVSLQGTSADHAAMYAPWVLAADATQGGMVRPFPPCGFVAGICARTDAALGVWKAPGGAGAQLIGSAGLALAIDDAHNDAINRAGINCLRHFPATGDVVWGARTMAGSDAQNSQWKYVPVRRLALFIEASIARGLQWAVFEPNAEALWSAVRDAVDDFLHQQWTRGALKGTTPREAWFVHCDATTMSQADIDNGHLVVVIGIAPTRPAEFVILRIGAFAQCRIC